MTIGARASPSSPVSSSRSNAPVIRPRCLRRSITRVLLATSAPRIAAARTTARVSRASSHWASWNSAPPTRPRSLRSGSSSRTARLPSVRWRRTFPLPASTAQQAGALVERLEDQVEPALLEVTEPPVDEAARPRAGAFAEVPRLHQHDAQPAEGRVARDPGAGDPAADDQHLGAGGGEVPE